LAKTSKRTKRPSWRMVSARLSTEPLTRARLQESVGLSRRAVTPRSNSADLSFKNSSFTIRMSSEMSEVLVLSPVSRIQA
jgi:hypothetical protein